VRHFCGYELVPIGPWWSFRHDRLSRLLELKLPKARIARLRGAARGRSPASDEPGVRGRAPTKRKTL
jgi:hypothetical protein